MLRRAVMILVENIAPLWIFEEFSTMPLQPHPSQIIFCLQEMFLLVVMHQMFFLSKIFPYSTFFPFLYSLFAGTIFKTWSSVCRTQINKLGNTILQIYLSSPSDVNISTKGHEITFLTVQIVYQLKISLLATSVHQCDNFA